MNFFWGNPKKYFIAKLKKHNHYSRKNYPREKVIFLIYSVRHGVIFVNFRHNSENLTSQCYEIDESPLSNGAVMSF